MKTLHLFRHAKSSWKDHSLSDRERGLNGRGRLAAPRMGAALASQLAPQSVAVSPARRAQLTLSGLCQGWPALADQEHRTIEALYTFDSDELSRWLRQQPDSCSELFLIGHNPALTDLVNELAPAAQLVNLPTAGYVQLRLPLAHWSGLVEGIATLEYRLFPRELLDP
ncbi:MAG: histidine phosphatase family protein [Halieaceae bacterium]